MHSFDDILRQFDYTLPDELIAHTPADPRDSSQLLIHHRKSGETKWDIFHNVGDYLPQNALLVLNETKVIPARLVLTRVTGGKVAVLCLGLEGELVRVLANRKLKLGEALTIGDDALFSVEGQDEKYWLLRPMFPLAQFHRILDTHGDMPLPPYIHSPLSREELKRQYQTVFAKEEGSVAAPTASLHFTPELLLRLQEQGIGFARVTLHVHLGTFAPLTEEHWNSGTLHAERYHIDAESVVQLEQAKAEGRTIIPVGTTALRTLESAFDAQGKCIAPKGETALFIREGYPFKMADGLITNFHVPKSSLLMLVCAFAGREAVLDLYRQAIERRLRFFSFGDGMLLL